MAIDDFVPYLMIYGTVLLVGPGKVEGVAQYEVLLKMIPQSRCNEVYRNATPDGLTH